MDTKAISSKAVLGYTTGYTDQYNPTLLYPIKRIGTRQNYGINLPLPFTGVDIWNAHELSWLDSMGKPHVAIGTFYFPYNSEYLVESKSCKLYLNSLNQTKFSSKKHLIDTVSRDLSHVVGTQVQVELTQLNNIPQHPWVQMPGKCLDKLEVSTSTYQVDSNYLEISDNQVDECVYTNLFRARCPVTQQPDWASILIHYKGQQIIPESLLKYLISYRNHPGFHESCVEQIFQDISGRACPKQLTVYARFTRRGGIDINPFRSNFEAAYPNIRLWRQ